MAGACSKLNEYMSIQRMFLERDKSKINVRCVAGRVVRALCVLVLVLWGCNVARYTRCAQWAEVVEYLDRHTQLPHHEFWTLLDDTDKCAMIESANRVGECEEKDLVLACAFALVVWLVT